MVHQWASLTVGTGPSPAATMRGRAEHTSGEKELGHLSSNRPLSLAEGHSEGC